MRIVTPYAIGAVVVALLLGALSRNLSSDTASVFWSNLLLNVIAELLGFAGAVVLGVVIATKFANDKLDQLAPRFVGIIRKLREDKNIEPETARGCVMCAVGLISEDHLKKNRSTISNAPSPPNCDVCGLTVNTLDDDRCQHCYLKGNIWGLQVDLDKR